MKILFINQVFYPDAASTGQHLTDLAVFLSSQGHQVTVFTSQRNYNRPEKLYSPVENYKGVRIQRVFSCSFGRSSKPGRILSALSLNIAFAWILLCSKQFDKVVALTSPPLVAWMASRIAAWKKIPFTYWVMDMNPDEAIEAGWIKRDSWIAKILEWVLFDTLRHSQKVIALDHFMKERLEQKKASIPDITVIPPWSHDEDIQTIPHDQNPFRTKHHLENKFVVMYSGNHSICHPLDTLLEAACELRDPGDIVFVFIGGGERVKDVTQFNNKHQLSNILQLPYQDRKDLALSLSAADLHVVVMGDPYVGIVHPCKIYGILKVNRPFIYIGPEKSHITEIMDQCGVSFGVQHGEAAKLADKITRMYQEQKSGSNVSVNKSTREISEKFEARLLIPKLAQQLTG